MAEAVNAQLLIATHETALGRVACREAAAEMCVESVAAVRSMEKKVICAAEHGCGAPCRMFSHIFISIREFARTESLTLSVFRESPAA
jgi:hypothetical protein